MMGQIWDSSGRKVWSELFVLRMGGPGACCSLMQKVHQRKLMDDAEDVTKGQEKSSSSTELGGKAGSTVCVVM